MKKNRFSLPFNLLQFFALSWTIPAFYLVLTGPTAVSRGVGNFLYGMVALLIAVDIYRQRSKLTQFALRWRVSWLDILIFFGALGSAWITQPPWSVLEWLLRLGFCGIVLIRLTQLLARWLAPHHLLQVLCLSAVLLAIAGGGFYWLEPQVLTYADGLWLAFITGATVGYGDLVPSTPASRIFAIFIVLFGYAVFSVVTASISALFISEDEKHFEKELHADIGELRKEIASLREEMLQSRTVTAVDPELQGNPPVKKSRVKVEFS